MNKIKHKAKPIPMEEALKDVIPIPWDESVLNGEKKFIIHLADEYLAKNLCIDPEQHMKAALAALDRGMPLDVFV